MRADHSLTAGDSDFYFVPADVWRLSDGGLLLRRRAAGRAEATGDGRKLESNARTVNGCTMNVAPAKTWNEDVIRPLNNPLVASDSLAVPRGNLAPSGAVIKPPAAEPRLHRHAGRALVFEDYNHMAARIDDPDLDVDENSVLVLQNAGPLGAPGMPEWGQLPIPKHSCTSEICSHRTGNSAPSQR